VRLPKSRLNLLPASWHRASRWTRNKTGSNACRTDKNKKRPDNSCF
jgi:hypothetical protein